MTELQRDMMERRMGLEAKIAWSSVGAIMCLLAAMILGAAYAVMLIRMAQLGFARNFVFAPIGIALLFFSTLLMIASATFFRASRRLTRIRKDDFEQKKAFK